MMTRLIPVLRVLTVISLACCSLATEFPTLDHLKTSTPTSVQVQAVKDLIRRTLSNRAAEFIVEIDPSIGPQHKDTFQLSNADVGVRIRASSGVAGAWGFHYYLTQYCGCHIAWEGRQLNVPEALPAIPGGQVQVTSNDRFRYYANVCTMSYSFVWWNWTRWEEHIDWMALNAINLPLAFTGQETIWRRVYQKMGFTQVDLDRHFGGPAFLAWSRMGNMRGWGGPLPASWYTKQLEIQHKILQRMRTFGMLPVLPGFAGHVPDAITRIFPNATVTRLGDWGKLNATYCCTYLLDPRDPLFQKIGSSFITEMTNEFGTDHIYNADTFNEMQPPSSDPAYIQSAGRAVYDGMVTADPQAIWLMQGWLFLSTGFWKPPQTRALLTSVPTGKMIVLDLFAEGTPFYARTDSFYGQPFIWCMLHNFGGILGLHGSLDRINTGPIVARNKSTSMVGTGLTMEGIFQNYVVYEFMLENTWRTKPRNISQWITEYARRRYHTVDEHVENMWRILASTVYNDSALVGSNPHQIITWRPSLSLQPVLWYNTDLLFKAWSLVVRRAHRYTNSALYRYDLVDITRQALQVLGIMKYMSIVAAFRDKDLEVLTKAGEQMSKLLDDLDMILVSDSHFLLGSWIQEARLLGTNTQDRNLYEFNAKNQITLWGPEGNIHDYATKQWAGIVKRYYKPRWELFVRSLASSVIMHQKFNFSEFKSSVLNTVEKPWNYDSVEYTSVPIGNSVKIASMLYKEYKGLVHCKMTHQFYELIPHLCQNRKTCARNMGKWLSKECRRRRRKHQEKIVCDFYQ